MDHGTQVVGRQDKRPLRTSEIIAQEIEGSEDPIKIIELSKELHEAMLEEQRKKVKTRLGRIAKFPPIDRSEING